MLCLWHCKGHAAQIEELHGQVGRLHHALSDAERRVLEGEMLRRKLHNIIQVCCMLLSPAHPQAEQHIQHGEVS